MPFRVPLSGGCGRISAVIGEQADANRRPSGVQGRVWRWLRSAENCGTAATVGCCGLNLRGVCARASARSSAGTRRARRMRASCSIRWIRLCTIGGLRTAVTLCITAAAAARADSAGRRNTPWEKIAMTVVNRKRKPVPTVDGESFQAAWAWTASLQFQGRRWLSLEARCPLASWLIA